MSPQRLAPKRSRAGLPALAALAGFALAAMLLAPSLLGRNAFVAAGVWQRAWPWRTIAPPRALAIPQNPLLRDQAVLYAPQLRVVYESIRQGNLPLWNPYFGSGEPLLPTAVSGPLAPTNLPILLLPWPLGFAWSAWLRFGLMWAGSYLFGRQLRLGVGGSSALAVGMCLAPGFAGYFVQPHATAHLYLPWLLWSLERVAHAVDAGGRALVRAAWPLALLQLGVLLSGHPDSAFHVTFAAALYGLVRLPWLPLRVALASRTASALAIGLGCAMAAPVLVPFADWLLDSATFAARAAPGASWVFDREAYPLFWDPFALGSPLPGAARPWHGATNWEEEQQYIGLAPWVFLGLGVAFAQRGAVRRDGDAQRWAALAVLALVCGSLAYGWPPLHGWLASGAPFAFSANPRMRFAFHTSVLGAALLASRTWLGTGRERTGELAPLSLLAFAALGAGALLSLGGPSAPALRPWLALASALALWAGGWLAPSERARNAAAVLLPLLLFADLAPTYAGLYPQVPRVWAEPERAIAALPPELAREPYPRIASDATLPPNLSALLGAVSPIAYSYPVSKRYQAFASGVLGILDPSFQIYPAEMQRPALRTGLARAGADWLVTAADLHADDASSELELVAHPGAVFVYRVRAALPWVAWHSRDEVNVVAGLAESVAALRDSLDARVEPIFVEANGPRVVAQAPATAGIEARASYVTPQRIEIDVPTEAHARDGVLVVRVSYDKGWNARDGGGHALALRPAQLRFLAVEVPPGVERVVLRFEPPGSGVSLAAAGAAALAVLAVAWGSRRKGRPG
jgi:hypothetical protein